jgi:iron-sulfur cluster assembly protein/iron-sulfur cluster insertion protein
MFFDTEQGDDDIVRSYGEVRVVVDSASAELLNGAVLDYKDGLSDAGFHITNPNATRTCGCGSSFS